MKREFITRHSDALGEDVSLIVYGEKGHPVIAFQAQDAKCNNFEDFGMIDTIADYIDNGTLQVFSVDNFDEESWSAQGDVAQRGARQEAYFRFVTDELVPWVHELNGSDLRPLTTGCSMGATHAAIAAFRRPDLFQGCIALSGVYDAHRFFGEWMNEDIYNNSIPTFLPNMPEDHPYIPLYAQRQLVLCVGQGAWEEAGMEDLRVIRDTCRAKGIDVWCDFWGNDVYHDWPWWKKQIRYFLPIVLDDMAKTMAAEAAEQKAAEPVVEEAKAEEPQVEEAKPAKKPTRRTTARKTAAKKDEEAPATEAKPAAKKTTTRRTTKKAAEAEVAAPEAVEVPATKPATKRRTTKKADAPSKAATAVETPAKKPAAKRTTRRTTKKTEE